MKKKNINLRVLITVLCVLLLSFNLNAQLADIQVGTATRKMLVYAPTGIDQNCPLLISMHGMNQDIYYQQSQTKWETIAKANGFVLVYPAGVNNSWDLSGTSDTDFILAIINEMAKRYGIDRNRVYLSGFSMGGMMTYHAMNVIADKIAAFAPVSGYLMGGPDTKSLRPVPIIHTHGTADDVVPFSGVQTCLNAWITRNKCPQTAKVTKPYPTNKPNSSGSKYYWGAGTDSVEIVLMRIENAGHWHSIDPNGINTSQEIWDFCKKFSLGFGIPKFKSASVAEINPKQIQVVFSLPIKAVSSFKGFIVKVDNKEVAIDSVVLSDPNTLIINLRGSILNNNEILLSYSNGNVISTYEKALVSFKETMVDNFLIGASPRIMELKTTKNGDTLMVKFNVKMQLPSDVDSLVFKAKYNEEMNIPILKSSILKNDSTVLAFSLGKQVFADYNLSLSYSGNGITSIKSGLLKIFSDVQVTNKSIGLPVTIKSGALDASSTSITLEFTKPMVMTDDQLKQIIFKANNKNASIKALLVSNNTIGFTLTNNLHYGDSISVSYTPGSITAADKGPLAVFSNFKVVNRLIIPTYSVIPGKTEAENYDLQFGTDKEQTSDTGGGTDVGWIDTGDWLEYAVENTTTETNYQVAFRVAAQAAGGVFNYYIDNYNIGQVVVPNTGGWQTWQSVVKTIKIDQGKHYFKIIAVTGGFNFNFFDFEKSFTGVNELNVDGIKIYPSQTSNFVVINSTSFRYDKVEIFDMTGKVVMSKSIPYQPELQLPVSFSNGVFIVKISNRQDHYEKRIVIIQN